MLVVASIGAGWLLPRSHPAPPAVGDLFAVSTAPLVVVDEAEVEISAVRAQGAGGQNVNKVSSAIHLRFDVAASSLPEAVKARLLALRDRRISEEGVVVIKAQRHRSQELNRRDALERLNALVAKAAEVPPARKPTRPTRASKRRRLEAKGAARGGEGGPRQGRRLEAVDNPRMAKEKSIYTCTECGGTQPEVAGQVPELRRLEHAGRGGRRERGQDALRHRRRAA